MSICGADSRVHCSALLTTCISAARAWAWTITSKRFHSLRRAFTRRFVYFALDSATRPTAGLGKLTSRLHLHDSYLQSANARSIVSGLYPAPSKLL